MTPRVFEMYTDGSFNSATGVYGGGYSVKNLLEGSVSGSDPEFASARNVAGECQAVIRGIKALIDQEKLTALDKIVICHDYTGLADWAEGRWKAKKPVAVKYVAAIQLYRDKGLILEFKKVPAHSGVAENEKVDQLAKQAVGLFKK
ncbi:RNase H family protein [Lactovum odontotermitis]